MPPAAGVAALPGMLVPVLRVLVPATVMIEAVGLAVRAPDLERRLCRGLGPVRMPITHADLSARECPKKDRQRQQPICGLLLELGGVHGRRTAIKPQYACFRYFVSPNWCVCGRSFWRSPRRRPLAILQDGQSRPARDLTSESLEATLVAAEGARTALREALRHAGCRAPVDGVGARRGWRSGAREALRLPDHPGDGRDVLGAAPGG